MKTKSFIILIFAVLFMFTACANDNITDDPDLDDATVGENINDEISEEPSDEVVEDFSEEIVEETEEPFDEVIEEVVEEEPIADELPPLEETELGQASYTVSPIQFMSEAEAAKITGGKLVYMPEHNFMIGGSTEYKAYLTPSGKLVYMTDYIFSRLDGASDFEVSWGFKDLNELNIRTDMGNTDDGTVLVSAVLSDKTAVKYDLFLDQWDGEPVSGLEGILCYAKVSSGTLFFDMGLTMNDPDFEGYDVTYTFTGNPYYEPQTLTSKVGQTVYIENISRIYPFDSDVEWKINAEIKDSDGNIVYTEDLTVCESYNPLDNTFFVSKGEKFVQ